MKIVLRGGHSPRCSGAKGYLDEQPCCRNLASAVADILKEVGNTVYLLESNESDVNSDLRLSKSWSDKYKPDLFASIHMNAGGGQGSEFWIYDSGKTFAKNIGYRFCQNMSKLGFTNRGMKISKSLYELRATSCPSIIFETMFVDSKKDKELWDKNTLDALARAIANGIDPRVSTVKEEPKYRILCYGMSEVRAKEGCDILKKYGGFKCDYERM